MGGVVGDETLRHQRFLLRVSEFLILKKLPGKRQDCDRPAPPDGSFRSEIYGNRAVFLGE